MLAMFKTIKSFIYKEINAYDQKLIKKINQPGNNDKQNKSKISVSNSNGMRKINNQ